MKCAYNELYVDTVQENIGFLFHFMLCEKNALLKDFIYTFVNSPLITHIEKGNPKYLSGKSGAELVRLIFNSDVQNTLNDEKTPFYAGKEYWCGWVSAYYQWYRNCSFKTIFSNFSIQKMLSLYSILYQADISKTVELFDEKIQVSKIYYFDKNDQLKSYAKKGL